MPDLATTYADYADRLHRFAYRRLGNHDDAADVVQTAFCQALSKLDRYDERGCPLSAWLYRIVEHRVIDVVRNRAVRRRREVILVDDWAGTVDGPGPDTIDARHHARRALAALPLDQRRALWLHHGLDWSLTDVAAELGRSVGATKALIHRAKAGAREVLL